MRMSIIFLNGFSLKTLKKYLMKHLQKDRHLVVEKFSNGVYHIVKETSSNEQLSSKIDYLENLLKQNNIQFD